MSKSLKKSGKRVAYEDEVEVLQRNADHRHSKMNKYQSEEEQYFDEDFEYAEDVRYFLKK